MDYVNFLFRPVNTCIVFQIPHANEPLKKIDWHDYKKIAEDEQRKGTKYMYTKTENRDIQQFTIPIFFVLKLAMGHSDICNENIE